MRAAGRLLELVVIPGAKHGSGMMPNFNVWKVGHTNTNTITQLINTQMQIHKYMEAE